MRNTFFVFAAILLTVIFAFGQNEQAPIVEKEINYKNWTYKSVRTGEDTNLRDLTVGKKLVIVVYYAPWCGNWRYDAPMLQKLYDKYRSDGLEIVAVGEYDPVSSMQNNLTFMKITFPAVYESENRSEKQKTKHYDYRQSTGDTRGWGSPWYIFLQPSLMEKKGDTLTKKTFVINGEMIAAEGEKFIREKLGLPAIEAKSATAKNGEIEVCDPTEKKTTELKKP
ncbi:MAG: redoxin domain-containing protein [Chloracidobacterium sp.]|nr:redoxin domain-containing protein [Chloracidobacterium sp.]